MSAILRWKCRRPGDLDGKIYPMVCVDEQTEVEYAFYGDLMERKTFIFHDGSTAGRNQANYLAQCLHESGEAVRDLGLPGIVGIYSYADEHIIYERRRLASMGGFAHV